MAFAKSLIGLRLGRQIADLTAQRDGLVAERDELVARVAKSEQPPQQPQPVDVSDVVAALRSRIPTLPLMPQWAVLSSAKSVDELAQGIHFAILQAHRNGQYEGIAAAQKGAS